MPAVPHGARGPWPTWAGFDCRHRARARPGNRRVPCNRVLTAQQRRRRNRVSRGWRALARRSLSLLRMTVHQILLLVHEKSANGHDVGEVKALATSLRERLPHAIAIEARAANDHDAVKACAHAFAAAHDGPSVIIAGGGGGTLRAV